MNDDLYNKGLYADATIAREWSAWIESLQGETREREIYPWFSSWIRRTRPGTILEIGSGQGICSEKIDFLGVRYVGVEPALHLRNRAHSLYPARTFIPGSAEQLPFDDQSFDAIFSVFVWQHLPDLKVAARELVRVLKPSGFFAVVCPNPELYELWLSWQKNVVITGKEARGDFRMCSNHHMYLHTREEITSAFAENFLVVDEVIPCGLAQDRFPAGFTLIFSGHKKYA